MVKSIYRPARFMAHGLCIQYM